MIKEKTISGSSYIGGVWLKPTGELFSSINPVTDESIGRFYTSEDKEIELAMHKAQDAFETYRNLSGKEIAQFLYAIADEIEALGDTLLEVGHRESGLGIPRLTGERGRTCGQIRAFASIAATGQWTQPSIDTAIPDRQPVPKPDIRRMMRPIGPVVVFGASNFPFAFGSLGGDTASALAAGNPVVVKGHPSHPETSELFAQAVETAASKTNMPKGVFSLLQGVGNDLGAKLVKHPLTQAVGFTGSFKGGKALMDIAASRPDPIPVYAEMGSINPVFIGKKALENKKEELIAGLSTSVCLGVGQFCTNPGLIVTTIDEEFINGLASQLNDNSRGVMLNKGILSSYYHGLVRLKNNPNVEWVNEAEWNENEKTPPNALFKTTIDHFINDKSLHEEIFGPVTLVVEVTCDKDMLRLAKHLEGQLTATIHSDGDDELTSQLINILELKVGRIIFNGYPTGVDVNPSMQHGGPYPASSIGWATSVGGEAIVRFARFVAYQNIPDKLLPDILKNENPLQLYRKLNGEYSDKVI
ncbi:aldehyde dehydrogenase (NADP(+)) [Flammeovirga sp. OC4]|uniref:aldehyde dehydrogenase (NADP(+)) n=1 Tax=Flammeovirga sp. OC4 TaxID=1382345 RepID=UPI0005C55B20|nr:aldehyde dehydrogenase (NADP(+)) [Flammeovirga sp. OC4]